MLSDDFDLEKFKDSFKRKVKLLLVGRLEQLHTTVYYVSAIFNTIF